MIKKYTKIGTALILMLLLFIIYAAFIEPKQLKWEHITIPIPQKHTSIQSLKIIQFSDTHVKNEKEQKQLKKIVEQINQAKADFVIFTGDLIDNPNQFMYEDVLVELLGSIQAHYGKLAIFGNHDHGGNGTRMYTHIMENSNFQLLRNHSTSFEIKNKTLTFVGIDDMILGQPDYKLLHTPKNDNVYTILLAHEPDFALELSQNVADLILAGHSHGGQIQFPFLGAWIRPIGAKVFTEGKYELVKQNSQLYVNTGVGTTRIPLRFLVPPSITQFEFQVYS